MEQKKDKNGVIEGPDAKWCPYMAISGFDPKCKGPMCQMWRGGPDAGDCALKFPMRTLGGGGV